MHRRRGQGGGDNPRPGRRARRDQDNNNQDETNPLMIPEIQRQIVVFLNAPELFVWMRVNRSFSQAARDANSWGRLAERRFGIDPERGIEGYKLGVSFLRRPVEFLLCEEEDFGSGESFITGHPQLCVNPSYLVTVSDDIDSRDQDPPFPIGGRNIILFRDATTLNYIRSVPSDIGNWKVAICGEQGREIFVTSHILQISARRGARESYLELTSFLPAAVMEQLPHFIPDNGTPILGCETHLIIAVAGRIVLFDVDLPDGSLIRLNSVVPISEDFFGTPKELKWCVDDPSTFIFDEPIWKRICVWRLNAQEGTVTPLRTINVDGPLRPTIEGFEQGDMSIESVALSKHFIVGADNEKKIYVWDRNTGDLLHRDLCDVTLNHDEYIEEEFFIFSLSLCAISGGLLVSSSRLGAHLCVWSLSTGNLLARHESTENNDLPDGVDMHSLVQLPTFQNAFAAAAGSIDIWGFPTNDLSYRRMLSIGRRERDIYRLSVGAQQGGMPRDNEFVRQAALRPPPRLQNPVNLPVQDDGDY